MANTLLSNAEITYETGRVLVNKLSMGGRVNRQYSSMFVDGRNGETVFLRKPPRYVVTIGRAAEVQDITETYVPLSASRQINISLNWTSAQRALSMANFRRRIIEPAMSPLASQIDKDIASLYYQIYNTMGTPGTVPNSLTPFYNAHARLLNESAPDDGNWFSIVTPATNASVADSLKGLFNPTSTISEQYKRGRMGSAIGFEWDYDQNLPTHTVGALGGTPLVNGANQTGSSLVTDGWTSAAATRLNAGDVFTIGTGATGCYAVNPVTKQNTGELRQFVCLEDGVSDGSGNMTISISPEIVISGGQQTVAASPANNAAITVLGAANTVSPQNLVFHPDAFAVGFVDLPEPYTGDSFRVTSDELGIAMRVWQSSDWQQDLHGVRIDALYGYTVFYPEFAGRVAS